MPDYAALLDDEVKAFLAKSDSFYPPDAVDLSITEQRRVYDRMCAAFDVGRPDGVHVSDLVYGAVPCRLYETAMPSGTLVYYHGGGFVVGGLASHDSICAEICAGTGLRVVAVDYRLSPEHPHPADYQDALAAFDGIRAAHSGALLVAGDSAGGNLAAAVAIARSGETRLKGALLIYPGLGGDQTGPSYQTHPNAPGLSLRDLAFYAGVRSGGQDKRTDPTFAPLAAEDAALARHAPTVALTAECDPLSSDGAAYVARLRANGVAAVWYEEPGLVHAHLRARHMSGKARAAFARVLQSLTALHAGRLPDLP